MRSFRQMKDTKRGNSKVIFSKSFIFVILLFSLILFYPPYSYAQPLPPSEHIFSYEEFVSNNAYTGEFVSVNAKVDRIERSKDLDWYRIRLLSLEGKELSNKGLVLVNHSCEIEFLEGGILTKDEDIGIAIENGDNIVVVGKAGRIVGKNREMHVNGEGTVILLLSEEEYEKWKSAKGRTVREFSSNFDVVESYEVVGGELKMNRRVETRKFFALGDYDLSSLAGNYELLDADGDKLMSPLDPYPDTKDEDGDGLDDKEEMEFRTSAAAKDTDGDGISDYDEVQGTVGYKMNPILKDTDGDGVTDYEELFGFEVGGVTYKTNPLIKDTDGDGKIDSVDDRPCEAEKLIDADKDGLSDIEEKESGTDPNDQDTDDDGLTDFEEVKGTKGFVTNPLKKDTDGDGLLDLEEIRGVEILSEGEFSRYKRLIGEFNNIYISNPSKFDTKGVGRSDKKEVERQREEKREELEKEERIKQAETEKGEKILFIIISLLSISAIVLVIVLIRWKNIAPVNADVKIERRLFRKK